MPVEKQQLFVATCKECPNGGWQGNPTRNQQDAEQQLADHNAKVHPENQDEDDG